MSKKNNNKTQVFSIGYELYNSNTFFLRLKRAKVDFLIDVREMPISRKRGFSKSSLIESSKRNGIEYLHLKSLGVPKNIRNQLKGSKNYEKYFKDYGKYLYYQSDSIDHLLSLIKENTCCIMCLEHNHEGCHRNLILEELRRKKKDIEPVYLE